MELIRSVRVSGFRSLRDEKVESLSDFSAFVGKNSSGKSNILRSLNLFFNDEVEPKRELDWERDFNQYAAKISRRKRRIEIEVQFQIPDHFRFRKELIPTQNLLKSSDDIYIKKAIEPERTEFFLNGNLLDADDSIKINQFLDLIKFRYIPNRVLPFDIIEDEQDGLARRLVKRLALKKEGATTAFAALTQQASEFSKRLGSVFDNASPDVKRVDLNTPKNWEDVVFILGYSFISRHNEKISTSGELEGAGNQSLLMLETLRLIDADYSMSFGWRQATVWAYEEPESSLHYSLEALVASRLRSYAKDNDERLQVIISTYSNTFAENADSTFHVEKITGETKINAIPPERIRSGHFSKHGVTRYSHPILFFPRKHLILVEGKFDFQAFEKIKSFLTFKDDVEFTYIEMLSDADGETGGDEQIVDYLKSYKNLIDARFDDAPLIVLLDWDASKAAKKLEKLAKNHSNLKPLIWPLSDLNPELSQDFKGLERALGTELVERAASNTSITLTTRKGTKGYSFDPRDRETLKREIWRLVALEQDLANLQRILSATQRIVGEIVNPQPQGNMI